MRKIYELSFEFENAYFVTAKKRITDEFIEKSGFASLEDYIRKEIIEIAEYFNIESDGDQFECDPFGDNYSTTIKVTVETLYLDKV